MHAPRSLRPNSDEPSRCHKSTPGRSSAHSLASSLLLFPTAANCKLPSRRGQHCVVNSNKQHPVSMPVEPNDPTTAIGTKERDQFDIGISRTESQHRTPLPTPKPTCVCGWPPESRCLPSNVEHRFCGSKSIPSTVIQHNWLAPNRSEQPRLYRSCCSGPLVCRDPGYRTLLGIFAFCVGCSSDPDCGKRYVPRSHKHPRPICPHSLPCPACMGGERFGWFTM